MSQVMAMMRNNITKNYSGVTITRMGDSLGITQKIPASEYNTETVQEWVDPYVKLNPKTNRYSKVKGYYRQTEKVTSIKGFKSALSQDSDKEVVSKALGLGK